MNDAFNPVWNLLWAWLRWSDIQTGKPASYKNSLASYPFEDPGINEETALKVDKAVATLKKEDPMLCSCMMCFLRKESAYIVASRFNLSENAASEILDKSAEKIGKFLQEM